MNEKAPRNSYGAFKGQIRRGGGSGRIAFAELWSHNALSLGRFLTKRSYPQAASGPDKKMRSRSGALNHWPS
jgi:hypothetical protein